MSEKEKKATKAAAEASKPTEVVANQIISELDRVHMRIAKF